MKQKLMAMALLFGLFPAGSMAQVSVTTVQELNAACAKMDSASSLNACLALVNLALDNIRKEEQTGNLRYICNAEVINIRDAKQTFVTWAAAHPEAAGMDPEQGVRTALAAAYPCTYGVKEKLLGPPPPPPAPVHPAMPPRTGRNR